MTDAEFYQFITSVVAVFIALLALGLTIWQAHMTRQHNYKSVKPLLSFERYRDPMDPGFGIYLINCGLGPAIIIETKFFVDGKEINKDKINPWFHVLNLLKINVPNIQTGFYENDSVISPGARSTLLTIDKDTDPTIENQFKLAIPRIGIEIYYESIYGVKDIAILKPVT